MRDGRQVTVDDFTTDARWPSFAGVAAEAGVRSSLSVPLLAGTEVIGGLNMYGNAPAAFAAASRTSAQSFARQAAAILGYLQQLDSERAARAREHQVAAALQASLLPTLPELAGVTCAARYRSRDQDAQVGGDWYDVFSVPDGAIGVAIGDVMGHDLAAAAAMGQLRSVLRSYAYEGSSPSVVLDRLDRLVQGFDMAQLATAVYGRIILDGEATMMLFTNAGHLPPLVRRPDASTYRLHRGASPLIGALPPGQARRGEAAVALPPGSLLALYTDGLVETRHRDVDAGIDILSAALSDLPADTSPEEACDALLDAASTDNQDDDIALLVMRIDKTPLSQ
jgi:serine phosphatase RsbU (regulator of sigma subunit)